MAKKITVQEALSRVSAPKGLTSVIMGINNDDFSVLPHQNGISAGYEQAKEKVALYEKQIRECKSDWSYWSILGDLEYWRAILNILEAANIAGDNGLPDVPAPKMDGVVMDCISHVTNYGKKILSETKALHSPEKP